MTAGVLAVGLLWLAAALAAGWETWQAHRDRNAARTERIRARACLDRARDAFREIDRREEQLDFWETVMREAAGPPRRPPREPGIRDPRPA